MILTKWYEVVIFALICLLYFTWVFANDADRFVESSVYCEVYCCSKNTYETFKKIHIPANCNPFPN